MNVQAWKLRMLKIKKKKRIEAKKKLMANNDINIDKDVNVIETPETIIELDLSDKTVIELREIAKEKDVKNYYKLSKSELIEALKEL